jgi:hypothetical protein
MPVEALETTEDINFGTMTLEPNAVPELPTAVSLLDPDEAPVGLKGLIEDFL